MDYVSRWLAAAALAFASVGAPAQAQFLYSAKNDEKAKAAIAEYRTSRDAHLALFKSRRTALASFASRLDDAIAAEVAAERDRMVVEVLEAASPRDALGAKLDGRIEAITSFKPAALLRAAPGTTIARLLNRADLRQRIGDKAAYTMPASFDEAKGAAEMRQYVAGAHERLQAIPGFSYQSFCEKQVLAEFPDPSTSQAIPKLIAIARGLGFDKDSAAVGVQLNSICEAVRRAAPAPDILASDNEHAPLRALAGYALSPGDFSLPQSDAVALGQAARSSPNSTQRRLRSTYSFSDKRNLSRNATR